MSTWGQEPLNPPQLGSFSHLCCKIKWEHLLPPLCRAIKNRGSFDRDTVFTGHQELVKHSTDTKGHSWLGWVYTAPVGNVTVGGKGKQGGKVKRPQVLVSWSWWHWFQMGHGHFWVPGMLAKHCPEQNITGNIEQTTRVNQPHTEIISGKYRSH